MHAIRASKSVAALVLLEWKSIKLIVLLYPNSILLDPNVEEAPEPEKEVALIVPEEPILPVRQSIKTLTVLLSV